MNEKIEVIVSKCKLCQEYQMSNSKEPMTKGGKLLRPCKMNNWEQKNYLVILDNYSRHIKMSKLENTTSRTVVNHTKAKFGRNNSIDREK